MKKEIKVFIVALLLVLLIPIGVKANDETDNLMRKLAPDLENATFKMKRPASDEEAELSVTVYAMSVIDTEDYQIWVSCVAPYDICNVDFGTGEASESYDINVTYDGPGENATIEGYVSSLEPFDWSNPDYYIVSDMSLINYYLTGNKSELWNPGAPARALKFSTFNNTTKGSDVSYYFMVGMGTEDGLLMYENAIGEMGIFYNGYMYGRAQEGLYLKRVIYIPENTESNKDAYILAAQKRINDYLGNESVTVSYGGRLDELNATVKESERNACLEYDTPENCLLENMFGAEDDEFPVESDDGNYYIVTLDGRAYKFYIIKGTEEQMKAPVYNAMNLETNIEISSEDSSVPLDATLIVDDVDDATIGEKVGTDNYVAYDIKVHSDAKEADITKLSNGKFLVRIPVPEELKDKDELTVWYIPSSGEKEEHTVTPKTIEGKLYAEFETNHFSTYVLAEAVEEDEEEEEEQTTPDEQENTPNVPGNGETEDNSKTEDNPKTGDNIINYFVLFTISLIVFSCSLVYKFELNK